MALLILVSGCEAIAEFDRDKIAPITAPPASLRDASVGDAMAEASVGDGGVDGDVPVEVEAGTDADATLSPPDAEIPDASPEDAGDASPEDASDASPDAGDEDAGDAALDAN